ncbi:MAG: DEAD/DEAH box helicase, partial [Thermoprotei archaeon]
MALKFCKICGNFISPNDKISYREGVHTGCKDKDADDDLPEPFKYLDPCIKSILKMKDILNPTEIQRLAIPKILDNKNVLIIAPTGYGKTEAVILPLIHNLLSKKKKSNLEPVNVIYVNPLKALTRDLRDRIQDYVISCGLHVSAIYGDEPTKESIRNSHIIITTPESLEKILDITPRLWPFLYNLNSVVIDEVHELIGNKRGAHLLILLERLKWFIGHNFQRIGLSATIDNPERVAELLGGSDGKLEIINPSIKKEHEFKVYLAIPANDNEKADTFLASSRRISEIIENKKTLAFVNSRFTAERLHYALQELNIKNIKVHHSSISKEEREQIENDFKYGNLLGVVCTKTLELGIDIGEVQQVIQYRSPGSVSSLLQRAGRSGHKPNEITQCFLVSSDLDDAIESLTLVKMYKENILDESTILPKPLDVIAKELTGIGLQAHYALKRNINQNIKIDNTQDHPKPNINFAFNIIKNSKLFNNLTEEEFKEILKTLTNTEIIKINNNNIIVSKNFWNIWKYTKKDTTVKRGERKFSEFFSMIPKKEEFDVYDITSKKIIGKLDSLFVYRSVKPGTLIRLAGKNWNIIRINHEKELIFAKESHEKGEIPIWHSEGPTRSKTLTENLYELINNMINSINNKNLDKLLSNLGADKPTIDAIKEYIHNQINSKTPFPNKNTIVIEKVPNISTVFFFTYLGEKINRTLSSLITMKMITETPYIYTIITPYGFSINCKDTDPYKAFLNINPEETETLLNEYLNNYSPEVHMLIKEMAIHFGIKNIKNKPLPNILIKEAIRQAQTQYFDPNNTKETLKNIKNKLIEIKEITREKPSPFADSFKYWPQERPWYTDKEKIIMDALRKPRNLQQLKELTEGNIEYMKHIINKLSQ